MKFRKFGSCKKGTCKMKEWEKLELLNKVIFLLYLRQLKGSAETEAPALAVHDLEN